MKPNSLLKAYSTDFFEKLKAHFGVMREIGWLPETSEEAERAVFSANYFAEKGAGNIHQLIRAMELAEWSGDNISIASNKILFKRFFVGLGTGCFGVIAGFLLLQSLFTHPLDIIPKLLLAFLCAVGLWVGKTSITHAYYAATLKFWMNRNNIASVPFEATLQ